MDEIGDRRTAAGADVGRKGELRAELERRRGRRPAAGEVFVLAETAELPVEWVLLERHPRRARWLIAPADAFALAGSADLEISAEALAGPLGIRCGHAVWIDEDRLSPERRTGLLAPEHLEAARRLRRAVDDGCLEPSPLAEENDRDPERRAWDEDVLRPARALVAALPERLDGAGPTRGRRPLDLLRRTSPWLAAALLAVAMGLGWEVMRLRRLVIFDPQFESLVLGAGVRGEQEVRLEPGKRWLLMLLTVGRDVPQTSGARLSLVAGDGGHVASAVVAMVEPGSEIPLVIPTNRLAPGRYRLELTAPDGRTLAGETLRVVAP